ncbi:LysR family transcriptional regulator [Chromobacterium phragmitis]|uniref:LysR family transcriptional regulator n=1 Tax=Chromobacterium phragmitis TaxID=2202141 RepID=A0A344UDT1_9NEIS|nr:LysR family transcriptional regulator [Chromobacterium phragmitis]AXE32039.1 LysR family transcriptional regulator [Chromobacterium phragmitis]AXE33429.1 LysR family transcriptional regulator [Chromobacterium phragmitis]
MSLSLDALSAFVYAADLGSFSAAARRLGKSQSTISEAIANLEIDLGNPLFDRSSRQPALTAAGRLLLPQARQIMAGSQDMLRQAEQLIAGVETRLTIVLSDTFQSQTLESVACRLEERYPLLELECLAGEQEDVLDLILSGRAQLGLVGAMERYPPDIRHQRQREGSELALFASHRHPLADMPQVDEHALEPYRQLRLNTYCDKTPAHAGPRRWYAPSYLMLLDMARLGVGWAELPSWLVKSFGGGELKQLDAPGWPKRMPVDLVWAANRPLGAAAGWLLAQLTNGELNPPAPG